MHHSAPTESHPHEPRLLTAALGILLVLAMAAQPAAGLLERAAGSSGWFVTGERSLVAQIRRAVRRVNRVGRKAAAWFDAPPRLASLVTGRAPFAVAMSPLRTSLPPPALAR